MINAGAREVSRCRPRGISLLFHLAVRKLTALLGLRGSDVLSWACG